MSSKTGDEKKSGSEKEMRPWVSLEDPVVSKDKGHMFFHDPANNVTIAVMTRDNFINHVAENYGKNLSRNEKKDLLKSWGAYDLNPDKGVVVTYRDKDQFMILRGTMEDGKLTLTDSATATKTTKDGKTNPPEFKPMPQPIKLEMKAGESIDTKALDRLRVEVMLFALAKQGMPDGKFVAGGGDKLAVPNLNGGTKAQSI